MTLEEKSQAYAADKMCKALNLTPDCINRTDALIPKFCGRDLEEAYEDGYNAALESQWKDPKVELPDDGEVVLVRLGGSIGVDCCAHGAWVKFKSYLIQFWMRIPETPEKGGEK